MFLLSKMADLTFRNIKSWCLCIKINFCSFRSRKVLSTHITLYIVDLRCNRYLWVVEDGYIYDKDNTIGCCGLPGEWLWRLKRLRELSPRQQAEVALREGRYAGGGAVVQGSPDG